jgi:membrane associated rhomboid family serine protease
MGLYDREYSQERYESSYNYGPPMQMGLPGIPTAVKWLLIINVAVFLVVIAIKPLRDLIYNWLQIDPITLLRRLQLWRLVTYQFLHDPNSITHIAFNMIGLYFLGPALERYWGSRKFLTFYLSCGAAGGVLYLLLVSVGFLQAMPMVGASGAILGVLAACAILFPHFIVFIFLFPVPIRVAAIAFTAFYLITLTTKGTNAGGDAAHLAGMATGAIYVFSQSWQDRIKFKIQTIAYRRKSARQQNLQTELDRILAKVHKHGIHSLTSKEKRTLKQATEAEQKTRNKF